MADRLCPSYMMEMRGAGLTTYGKVPSFLSTESSDCRVIVVHGNAMLPLYRHGDHLIVSRISAIKIGDRVVLETLKDDFIAGTLMHRTDHEMSIYVGGSARREIVVSNETVAFMGRIIWASQ